MHIHINIKTQYFIMDNIRSSVLVGFNSIMQFLFLIVNSEIDNVVQIFLLSNILVIFNRNWGDNLRTKRFLKVGGCP